jgi:hypothetical protein
MAGWLNTFTAMLLLWDFTCSARNWAFNLPQKKMQRTSKENQQSP